MAKDNSTQGAIWPVPKFSFSVKLGGEMEDVSFQEVSGLDAESQPIEYRHGNSPAFSAIKMPGLNKSGNVTLKRGLIVKDDAFLEWYETIRMNTIKRKTVTIRLLDEHGNAQMSWNLHNAWPTKITATDLNSDGNEVAVESLELAFESLETKAPT